MVVFFLQETLKLGLETMGSMGFGMFGMFRDVSPGFSLKTNRKSKIHFSKARLRFLLPNSSQLHGLVAAPASDISASGTLATCLGAGGILRVKSCEVSDFFCFGDIRSHPEIMMFPSEYLIIWRFRGVNHGSCTGKQHSLYI